MAHSGYPLLCMVLGCETTNIQSMASRISPLEWKGSMEVEGREGKKKVGERSYNLGIWLCGISEI